MLNIFKTKANKPKKPRFSSNFRNPKALAVAAVFAVIGGYFVYRSFAAVSTVKVNFAPIGIEGSGKVDGYWMVAKDGGVFSQGTAAFKGSAANKNVKNIIGIDSTGKGSGYWLAGSDGAVYGYGLKHHGHMKGKKLNAPIVGIAARAQGDGYWLAGRDGGIYAFGKAPYKNSLPGLKVKVSNIVGITARPQGDGYWLVGSDGGVFAFGKAPYKGKPKISNAVAIEAAADGNGYWVVGADGGVFAYGSAKFYGSMGGKKLNGAVNGISRTSTGKGYWLSAKDGGVFAFGDAKFKGAVKVTMQTCWDGSKIPVGETCPPKPAPTTTTTTSGSGSGGGTSAPDPSKCTKNVNIITSKDGKDCIAKLQKDLGVTADGVWGPVTERAWLSKYKGMAVSVAEATRQLEEQREACNKPENAYKSECSQVLISMRLEEARKVDANRAKDSSQPSNKAEESHREIAKEVVNAPSGTMECGYGVSYKYCNSKL